MLLLDAIGRHARLASFRGGLPLYAWKQAKSIYRRERIQTVRKSPPNEPHLAFAVPGDLATPTGGYGYARRIIQELRELGWQVAVADIGDDFPFPSTAERAMALALLSAVPAGCPVVLDGLAFGALPEAGALRCRTPLIALVHQPLALDPGLHITQADTFRETGGVVRLLAVGSVVPVKGYDLLIAAAATLTDMPWRLTIAGDRTRNPAVAAQLDADIEAHGLGDRVAVLGAVPPERIVELYLASDVFVLASRFEGYGMALAEAIAHGLPVVSTMAGAIPDTVPAGTRLLVPLDDAAALAQALRRLISDRAERQQLAMKARAAAAQLPTWQDSARLFAGAVETVG